MQPACMRAVHAAQPEPQGGGTLQDMAWFGATHAHRAWSQCWEACIADEACGMWVWCSGKAGCDENGSFNGRFPYRSRCPPHAVSDSLYCAAQ